MTGWTSPYADDHRRITTICRRLDGMALAIELAAARVATLGLDGLDRGLADPLDLLTGGSADGPAAPVAARRARLEPRPALDRRAGGHPASLGVRQPVHRRSGGGGRGLRTAHDHRGRARPRQPGRAQPRGGGRRTVRHPLSDARADPAVRRRADGPGRRAGRRTSPTSALVPGDRDAAAVRWALPPSGSTRWPTTCAPRWAGRPADRRGMPTHTSSPCGWRSSPTRGGSSSEAQERYEEAAALAADPAEAAQALHLGAAVAWGRHAGNEAIRLYRAAAEAARRAGDPRRAAVELATAAEVITNAPGVMSELLPPGEEWALLAEARVLAGGDPQVEAAVLTVTTVGGRARPGVRRPGRTRRGAGPSGRRHPPGEPRARPADRCAPHLRRARRGRRHRPAPLGPARAPGQRRRDGVGVLGHPAHGADGVPGCRRSRGRPSLRPAAQRAAVLPRGGPPRRRVAADHGGDRR